MHNLNLGFLHSCFISRTEEKTNEFVKEHTFISISTRCQRIVNSRLPRMTDTQRLDILNAAAGLMVYVTDLNGGSFMFYDGNSWSAFASNTVPDAPTIGTATAEGITATVSYTQSASNGGSTITSYTATATSTTTDAHTISVTQAGSGDITVTGLTDGTTYTFTVTATNSIGTSLASAASNSVTPTIAIGDTY